MNRISQKMIDIAKKLKNSGDNTRSEQFIILADELEKSYKMDIIAHKRMNKESGMNVEEMLSSLSTPTLKKYKKDIEEELEKNKNNAALEKAHEKITREINKRAASVNIEQDLKNIFNTQLTPYKKYKG